MTAELFLHGRPISSVFELLGCRENDITFSVGWAFSRCPEFRRRFVEHVLPGIATPETDVVRLQEHGRGGITDIEIIGQNVHVIIEAKSGFKLPGSEQLTRYAERLNHQPRKHKVSVSLSEASKGFAATLLPNVVEGIPHIHVSLRDIDAIARTKSGSHAEKRLLAELRTYFNRIARMQDLSSNLVYVVCISKGYPTESEVSWRDMVEIHNRYLMPVGGAFPREPVNYLGFRYDSQLRAIRHAESCEIINSMDGMIQGCRYKLEAPHYLYTLGPSIVPSKVVRNGKTERANRVYAAIDLLLTCDTISEAGELTRKRLNPSAVDNPA